MRFASTIRKGAVWSLARPFRAGLLPGAALVLVSACALQDAKEPCEVSVDLPSMQEVAVDAGTPACTIEFVEVTRLRGSLVGTAPKPAIGAHPHGEYYVTRTYQPGEVAVWSSDGKLQHTFGRGGGQGPGEFTGATELVVDPDSEPDQVWIVTNRGRAHRHTLEGTLLGTSSGVNALNAALLSPGTLLVSGFGRTEGRGIEAWTKDTVRQIGPPQRTYGPFEIRPDSTGRGFWTVEGAYYELRHHHMPDGEVDLVVQRPLPTWWVEVSAEDRSRGRLKTVIRGYSVDPGGVAFVNVLTPDPDATAESGPAETLHLRVDGWMEAFTLDGRLLASVRFDDPDDVPTPLSNGQWYFVDDDLLKSITIVEPRLIAR